MRVAQLGPLLRGGLPNVGSGRAAEKRDQLGAVGPCRRSRPHAIERDESSRPWAPNGQGRMGATNQACEGRVRPRRQVRDAEHRHANRFDERAIAARDRRGARDGC
jgi:hypothetical protein